MKKTVSMPAERTPSMARALELMPPSAISEITTESTMTSRTPKMSGGA